MLTCLFFMKVEIISCSMYQMSPMDLFTPQRVKGVRLTDSMCCMSRIPMYD